MVTLLLFVGWVMELPLVMLLRSKIKLLPVVPAWGGTE